MARTVILGKSGSGKSWYAGERIEEILEPEDEEDEFEYAIHYDLEDEEQGLSSKESEHPPLLKTFEVDKETLRDQVAIDPDDPPSYIPEEELQDGNIVALPKWVVYKNKYVRVVPQGLTDEEMVVLAEMIADAAMTAGDCHFSMDEAHEVATQGQMGRRLKRLVTGGRKHGVEWVFITQRPQAIHKQILAQADIGVFLKLTSDRDVKKADSLAESFDAEDVLPSLPERTVIIEDYSSGDVRKVDTNNLERRRDHVAGDDGKSNDKWLDGDKIDEDAVEDES